MVPQGFQARLERISESLVKVSPSLVRVAVYLSLRLLDSKIIKALELRVVRCDRFGKSLEHIRVSQVAFSQINLPPVRVSLENVTQRRFWIGLFDLAEDLDSSIDVAVHQELHTMASGCDPLLLCGGRLLRPNKRRASHDPHHKQRNRILQESSPFDY
jgi:hypothetical protein